MGSRVSSERPAPAKLPVIGTTWYRRGPAYWTRRVVLGGFPVVVVGGVAALLVYGFFDLVSGLPTGRRVLCDAAYCAVSAAAGVWGWVRARRQVRRALAVPPEPGAVRRDSAAQQGRAPGLASAGRLPAVLLAPLLAPLFTWFLGTLLAASLVRELPAEAGARRALDRS